MSKKSFSSAAKSSQDAFNAIATGGQNDTYATSSPQTALDGQATLSASGISDTMNINAIRATSDTPATPEHRTHYIKFNLRMPVEMKEYLEKAAFARSTPNHIVSVTQYLCELILKDMENGNRG